MKVLVNGEATELLASGRVPDLIAPFGPARFAAGARASRGTP